MNDIDLSKLPKTFYRVSVKACIKDEEDRLLVLTDGTGTWEIPGGGWEHGEVLEECITREIREVLEVDIATIDQMMATYVCRIPEGFLKLCILVSVTLASHEFTLGNDDIAESRYVTRDEFMALPFAQSEDGVQTALNQIWPPALN